MRKPRSIKRSDYARVLLTEVLPHELPIFFSNDRLYAYAAGEYPAAPALVRALLETKQDTIPYTYKIERGDGRKRSLSIMHPAVQLKFIDFYKKYDGYILNQCSKSHYSLRFPLQVGSVYYEKDLAIYEAVFSDQGDLAPSESADQRAFASSYFYYARYNRIWRFYDSTEFRRLEQDYRILWTLDVSKCFPSIYTHSISWAVRSKEFAKNHKKVESFDSDFDQLMRMANWGETNGILVGPEVSRLFAEIVLQEVDTQFRRSWHDSGRRNEDIAVRRYVDDFLLFANDGETLENAKRILESSLEKYNLTLNEAKTDRLESPLISNLSIARDSIRRLLEVELSPFLVWANVDEAMKDEHLGRTISERASDILIRKIKSTIKQHSASYSTIVPYSLGMIARSLDDALRKLKKKQQPVDSDPNVQYRMLSALLEVSFFLYRMDPRVPTTYRLSSILLTIDGISSLFGNLKLLIRREILDQGLSVLRQFRRASMTGIETSCLLATLFHIGDSQSISAIDLESALGYEGGRWADSDYFRMITSLYVARDSDQHGRLRLAACKEIAKAFSSGDVSLHKKGESVLLFFDAVACPYVDLATKHEIVQAMSLSVSKQPLSTEKANQVINYIGSHLGFSDWRGDVSLPAMLRRKELRPAYE